jgi:hypothetical protein
MSINLARRTPESAKAKVAEPLLPHWVKSQGEAAKAASSTDSRAVWIIRDPRLADLVARNLTAMQSTRKTGYLALLLNARPTILPSLFKRFKEVALLPNALPKQELEEVLGAPDRSERFVGGVVDPESGTITLWRGDLRQLIVPVEAFPKTGNDIRPNFDEFSVIDYGSTLKFGDYEAAADAVLYEYDSDFRRHLNKMRSAKEQTLGASIRRLRKQRQLTLHEFGNVGPKTLARIERGEVRKPRRSTLEAIARRLGVSVQELHTF